MFKRRQIFLSFAGIIMTVKWKLCSAASLTEIVVKEREFFCF